MTRECVFSSPSARKFPIDGGLLLLNEETNCLFVFNATASELWDLIGPGLTEKELAVELADLWRIPLPRALADVQSIVAQWRRQGLLAGDEKTSFDAAVPVHDPKWPEARTPEWAAEWTCSIRGKTIAFATEAEPSGLLRALLRPLEVPESNVDACIELRDAPGGETAMLRDGVERIRTADPAALIGAIWQTILEIIHGDCEWLALIHGAAIAHEGAAIALCAPSGSRKSTLAAGLIQAGFDYLTDDLVAVTASDGTVLPFPLPLSVKPGSQSVLSAHGWDFSSAPRYRTKGVEARLLLPSGLSWDSRPAPLRILVFPRFSNGASPAIRRLSILDTIERLLADRIWIGHPIVAHRVEAFLKWLERIPAYSCEYGSLDDGVRLIRELMP